jgi:hypothetical protein
VAKPRIEELQSEIAWLKTELTLDGVNNIKAAGRSEDSKS